MTDVVWRAKAALEGVPDGGWTHVGGGHVEGPQSVPVAKVWGLNKAEFIAAARTLVPELVAEVERLRAEVDALRPEWGWDVKGRKRPNPAVVRGDDGRPVVERPRPSVDPGAVLYSRRVSGWERAK